ncbi:putative late blight resistance protein homolog R1A-3 [Olea europaea var. sylvestris]|uniref:putative late blight resistance protein homolog R1A-3 n=1 Tax=Olea europaea var. sylvestris TaxID=158386 RepID=UPI000C1CCCF0|nr:putative late blight resistance protein homolog R1A-3 [Olea europaea var. sylvestris]
MTVGLEKMTTQIASNLLGKPEYRQIISIAGMPGPGKTTLAKKIHKDSNVRHHFEKLSWRVVPQTYNKRKLLIDILSSLSDLDRDYISEIEDEGKLFPEDRNGSRILFTSRLKNVAPEISHVIIEPPLLSTDGSWDLLKKNVFKKERCPRELQDIGMQIAKNCHGLPLSVVTIAGVLSNMEKQASSWQREDEEIPVPRLLLLWIAEGFVEKKEQKSLEDVAEEYLTDLINRSPLQVGKRKVDNGVKALKCTSPDNRCPDLNFLLQLESLYMICRGIFKGDYSVVNFPRNIRKLTLSKFGLPWEKMSLIGTLPNLKILKLEEEAFEREIWDTKDDEFQKLKFHKLYCLDLKQWNSTDDHFPVLERLVFRTCKNLEIIPLEFSHIQTLQTIELYYCGKNVESLALEIREEPQDYGNEEFEVTIFDRDSLTSQTQCEVMTSLLQVKLNNDSVATVLNGREHKNFLSGCSISDCERRKIQNGAYDTQSFKLPNSSLLKFQPLARLSDLPPTAQSAVSYNLLILC